MNAQLPPVLALSLAPFMPQRSVVHEIFGSQANAIEIDLALNRSKTDDPLRQREANDAARVEAQFRMLTREA